MNGTSAPSSSPASALGAIIDELAATTNRLWRRHDFRTLGFSDIAAEAFARVRPAENLALEPTLHAALKMHLSSRRFARFYHPVIWVVHEDERFVITLHCWMDLVGTPHSHPWTGAFQVLSGPVLYTNYEFEPVDRINATLSLGTLHHTRCEVVPAGTIERIDNESYDKPLIHGLCHLTSPSLSLAIRGTEDAKSSGFQSFGRAGREFWGTAATGLCEQAAAASIGHTDRYLQALAEVEGTDYATQLASIAERLDIVDMFCLARQVGWHRWSDVEAALQAPRFDAWREAFKLCLCQVQAENQLAIGLDRYHTRDERLLLGLLRFAPSREALFTMLAEHSQHKSREQVLALLARVVAESGEQFTAVDLGALGAPLLAAMMSEPTVTHVLSALAEALGESEIQARREDIAQAVSDLNDAPLLKTVLLS